MAGILSYKFVYPVTHLRTWRSLVSRSQTSIFKLQGAIAYSIGAHKKQGLVWHPLRTFIVGYIPHNVLSYTVSIPSYSTGIYELKEIKYIYGELYESKI